MKYDAEEHSRIRVLNFLSASLGRLETAQALLEHQIPESPATRLAAHLVSGVRAEASDLRTDLYNKQVQKEQT